MSGLTPTHGIEVGMKVRRIAGRPGDLLKSGRVVAVLGEFGGDFGLAVRFGVDYDSTTVYSRQVEVVPEKALRDLVPGDRVFHPGLQTPEVVTLVRPRTAKARKFLCVEFESGHQWNAEADYPLEVQP